MPDDATFYTHDSEVRNESFDALFIARMDHDRSVDALLALALLLEQVTSVPALERDMTGPGLAKSLLGAAVGLELWHRARKYSDF